MVCSRVHGLSHGLANLPNSSYREASCQAGPRLATSRLRTFVPPSAPLPSDERRMRCAAAVCRCSRYLHGCRKHAVVTFACTGGVSCPTSGVIYSAAASSSVQLRCLRAQNRVPASQTLDGRTTRVLRCRHAKEDNTSGWVLL